MNYNRMIHLSVRFTQMWDIIISRSCCFQIGTQTLMDLLHRGLLFCDGDSWSGLHPGGDISLNADGIAVREINAGSFSVRREQLHLEINVKVYGKIEKSFSKCVTSDLVLLLSFFRYCILAFFKRHAWRICWKLCQCGSNETMFIRTIIILLYHYQKYDSFHAIEEILSYNPWLNSNSFIADLLIDISFLPPTWYHD